MLLSHLFENRVGLSEGGNVFDNTVAIDREFVPEIVRQIKKLLAGTNVYPDIGSAGYKIQSGDMDVMIDAQELIDRFGSADVKEAKKALQELLGRKKLETKLSGQNVHVKMPIPNGKFAQVDIMVIPDAAMVAPYHQHGPRGSYEDPGFKGSEIFIMIASIAKSMGLKFEPFGAKLVRRDTGDLVARSRDDVARILLNPNASGDDLNSVKSIMNALKDDPKREEKLAQARIDAEKGLIRLPESDVQEASSLDFDMDRSPSPDEEYDKKELKSTITKIMLSALTPMQERVVRMHLYQDMPFREIGEKIGVSGSWAQQIFLKALRKLRYPTRADVIKDFSAGHRNADESTDQVKGTEKARTVKPRPFAGSQPHPFQGRLVGGESKRDGITEAADDVFSPTTSGLKMSFRNPNQPEIPVPNLPDLSQFPRSYGMAEVDWNEAVRQFRDQLNNVTVPWGIFSVNVGSRANDPESEHYMPDEKIKQLIINNIAKNPNFASMAPAVKDAPPLVSIPSQDMIGKIGDLTSKGYEVSPEEIARIKQGAQGQMNLDPGKFVTMITPTPLPPVRGEPYAPVIAGPTPADDAGTSADDAGTSADTIAKAPDDQTQESQLDDLRNLAGIKK